MYVSMKGMLQRVNGGDYAVMAVNCLNIETARAVISAAQGLRAPIIMNIVREHMVDRYDSELTALIVELLVQRVSVGITLDFDHGKGIGYLKEVLHNGYSNTMVDASRHDLEDNTRVTKEIIEFTRQFDTSVEGEIGCMGGNEDGNHINDIMKTGPQQALRFVKETSIDVLAISSGSSHGDCPGGYVPEFDFERLKETKKSIRMPLVLHGGSSSGDKNIENCVKYGINKINAGCGLTNVNVDSIKKHLEKDPNIGYWAMIHQIETDSCKIIRHYIRLSKSEGKSL